MRRTQPAIAGFGGRDYGGRDYEPRNTGRLSNLKKARK